MKKIGQAASEASGQPVLGINIIGPYRMCKWWRCGFSWADQILGLLVTIGGLGVAFLFTIVPYPVTTRSLIRKDVSGVLYLLARNYSNVIALVRMRIDGTEGDLGSKRSHGSIYEKQRIKLMTESILTIDSLRQNTAFTVYEPSLRGKFPKEQYDAIIESCARLVSCCFGSVSNDPCSPS